MGDVTERNAGSVIEMASINPDEKTDLSMWLKMVEQLHHAPEWPEDELPIEMKERFYQCKNRAVAAILLLGLTLAMNPGVTAQDRPHDGMRLRIAYEHGYRAGYANGSDAEKNDFADRMGRDYQRYTLYQEADRCYESRFGPLVDYKEGYSLGFEVGYFDGYVGCAFDSRIPPNVAHPGGRSAPLMGRKDRERRKAQPK
jgi:hypothetical protein